MEASSLWFEAMAAVDMGLTLGDWNTCVNLGTTLCSASPSCARDVVDAWRNTYGIVPSLLHELANVRGPHVGVTQLALLFGRLRYTFLALSAQSMHRHQVRAAAEVRVGGFMVDPNPMVAYKQKGYVRTHANLMEGVGLSPPDAAAHAYFLHAPPTATPSVVASGARVARLGGLKMNPAPPGDADHLSLPPMYLGVDMDGHLLLLDAWRGASPVEVSNVVPHNWCVRVSSHTNEFVAGDTRTGVSLFLSLNDDCTVAHDVPVCLPRSPTSRVAEVDNTWLTWIGMNGGPRALEWDSATRSATVCSFEDAQLHASVGTPLHTQGAGVWCGSTCVACLPPSESITCVHGTPVGFDAFTQGGDWWRVDVRARRAWVVGIPNANNIVCAIAPLVEWSCA